MIMVFGHRHNGIKGLDRICLYLSFILSFQCCNTVMEIILLIFSFLNSEWFGWFSKNKGVWWGNLRERGHLGDPGVDGRIILR